MIQVTNCPLCKGIDIEVYAVGDIIYKTIPPRQTYISYCNQCETIIDKALLNIFPSALSVDVKVVEVVEGIKRV